MPDAYYVATSLTRSVSFLLAFSQPFHTGSARGQFVPGAYYVATSLTNFQFSIFNFQFSIILYSSACFSFSSARFSILDT